MDRFVCTLYQRMIISIVFVLLKSKGGVMKTNIMSRHAICCLIVVLFLGSMIRNAAAAVYYVRPDGGNATQCSGLTDTSLQEASNSMDCAWSHPFHALEGNDSPFWKIQGGDTLIIYPGSYQMGYGAPNTEWCASEYPWDCRLPPLPSGPDAEHPTRILGAGWEQGCPEPPELWGTERAYYLMDLDGASHVEIQCLELTDHSGCVEDHSDEQVRCKREGDYPFGSWASSGIYASDSSSVLLKNLNIHGFAHSGIHAGRLTDWTVENVRIAGNGWVGWDGDLYGDNDSNSGTLVFDHFTVEWNGCGETYPDKMPHSCWGQTAGGYGDGFGTGSTGGHWIFRDSVFRYNTSDGLDLLYVREPGTQIDIQRSQAYANAGDQFKTNGSVSIENCLAVSECSFFDGKPFTHHVDNCRSGGSAFSVTTRRGNQASLVHSTVAGEGDVLLLVVCEEEGSCDAVEVTVLNNIFREYQEFHDPSDISTYIWYEPSVFGTRLFDYNLVYHSEDTLRLGNISLSDHDINQDPQFVDDRLESFDYQLQATSPAIDAGILGSNVNYLLPDHDINGTYRPSGDGPDMGCYEFTQDDPPAKTITVLSQTSPNYTVTADTSALIYGTSKPNSIVLTSGAYAELLNFPGQNSVQILSDSNLFTVSRSGTVVTFDGTDGTVLKIPASATVQNIIFNDRDLTLMIDGNQVQLDDQVVGLAFEPIQ
jgi:hypothetical protein